MLPAHPSMARRAWRLLRGERAGRRALLALTCGGALVGTTAAHGQGVPAPPATVPAPPTGRTSALSWVRLPGAEGCIGAPALAAAVETRLARRVFVPPADAQISVEGTIAYRADTKRFKATFRVADHDGAVLGVREVEDTAASCDKLDERLAFVLSILIDPESALGAPAALAAPTAPAPTAEPASQPALATPPPKEAPAPTPPDAPAEPWRWMVGADFGGATGVVPGVGFLVSGSALVAPPRWPALRARGSSYLPTSRRIEGSARAEVSLVTGELAVCPLEFRRPPFGLTLCVGGLLGQLSARGEGFAASQSYDTLLGGVALDALAELAVTRSLMLTLSPSLLVPLSRARLAYDDATATRRTIFEVAPVGGSLALGLAVGSR